jgi:UDP:flavonoid glycosyltransferase YjiC (YdhE family)
MSDADCSRHRTDNMKVSNQPFHMGSIYASCQFFIGHGSSMAETVALYGKPQLLLPMQMEQTMRAKRLESFRSALVFLKREDPGRIEVLLKQLLRDQGLRQGSAQLQESMQAFSVENTVTTVCKSIIDLAAQSHSPPPLSKGD